MADIREFLTARLNEDEAVARAAAVRSSRHPGDRWQVGPATVREDYTFVSITTPPPEVVEIAGSGFDGTGGVHGQRFAVHIARWDPARVLAEISAKRAIVAEYLSLLEHREQYSETAEGWGGRTKLAYVLQLLAAPYADHPDYDPEWRIQY